MLHYQKEKQRRRVFNLDEEREHQPWDDSLSSLVRAAPEAFVALVFGKARFKSTARFPSPKMIRLAKGQAAMINDPKILQDLTLKVGLAQTAEEAQNYLLDWPDTEQMDNEVEGGK